MSPLYEQVKALLDANPGGPPGLREPLLALMTHHDERTAERERVVARLRETIKALVVPGNLPPTWLEASYLREQMQRLVEREDDEAVRRSLSDLLRELPPSDSLPVAIHLKRMGWQIDALREELANVTARCEQAESGAVSTIRRLHEFLADLSVPNLPDEMYDQRR